MKPGRTGNAQGEKYTSIERINPNTKIATYDVDGSSQAILRSIVSSISPVKAVSTTESNDFHPSVGSQ